jgi:hypothetical protein
MGDQFCDREVDGCRLLHPQRASCVNDEHFLHRCCEACCCKVAVSEISNALLSATMCTTGTHKATSWCRPVRLLGSVPIEHSMHIANRKLRRQVSIILHQTTTGANGARDLLVENQENRGLPTGSDPLSQCAMHLCCLTSFSQWSL